MFRPRDVEADTRLPVIVLCHGWGGKKAHLNQAIAPRFAAAGFVVLAFDYRGWGESDSRLVVTGEMPEPDENGRVTVEALAVRELVDPLDQQEDIDAAITFMEGEPYADPSRIGIWGSSFGGGHVIWRAATRLASQGCRGAGRSDGPGDDRCRQDHRLRRGTPERDQKGAWRAVAGTARPTINRKV